MGRRSDGPDQPSRGDARDVDLGNPMGHEQGGSGPALIVSVDQFNHGPAELVVLLPITKRDKRIRSHVPVKGGTAGLTVDSWIKCEDIRSVSTKRLTRFRGSVSDPILQACTKIVQILLGLP
jgi:mRNA interferase MazF